VPLSLSRLSVKTFSYRYHEFSAMAHCVKNTRPSNAPSESFFSSASTAVEEKKKGLRARGMRVSEGAMLRGVNELGLGMMRERLNKKYAVSTRSKIRVKSESNHGLPVTIPDYSVLFQLIMMDSLHTSD